MMDAAKIADLAILTDEDLNAVSNGRTNGQDPFVRAVLDAFGQAQAKAKSDLVELARSSGGGLGSTPHL